LIWFDFIYLFIFLSALKNFVQMLSIIMRGVKNELQGVDI